MGTSTPKFSQVFVALSTTNQNAIVLIGAQMSLKFNYAVGVVGWDQLILWCVTVRCGTIAVCLLCYGAFCDALWWRNVVYIYLLYAILGNFLTKNAFFIGDASNF